jgi:hypothetical protein
VLSTTVVRVETLANLLEQFLKRDRRRDPHLQNVTLVTRHAVAGLNRGDMTQPLRQVVGGRGVEWLDRHERCQRQSDHHGIAQRGIPRDDTIGFKPANPLMHRGHRKPCLLG